MKKLLLIAALLVLLTNSSQGQGYDLTVSTGTYADLTSSISLNNGFTWDDPDYSVPLGFSFSFFDVTASTLQLTDFGVLMLSGNKAYWVAPMFEDLMDRAINLTTIDVDDPGSQSNISYITEGSAPNRIFKAEWNNAGFYSDVSQDSVATDYVNYQMWLYEGSNTIEFHYGSSMITQPLINFESGVGPTVAIGWIDTTTFLGETLELRGSPASPTMTSIADVDLTLGLSSMIASGQIYTFSKWSTGVPAADPKQFVVTNPVNERVEIKGGKIEGMEVVDLLGRVVRTSTDNIMDVSDLSSGTYLITIHANDTTEIHRVVKH